VGGKPGSPFLWLLSFGEAKESGSSDFPVGNLSRIQIKSTAVEVDGDLEMVTIPESTGPFLYSSDL